MSKIRHFFKAWVWEFILFSKILIGFVAQNYLAKFFGLFELVKSAAVEKMYQKRGKYAIIFVHAGLVAVMALGVAVGPSLIVDTTQTRAVISSVTGAKVIFAENQKEEFGQSSLSAQEIPTLTQISDKPRSEVEDYTIQSGDTLSKVADKFGVSQDSIRWLNEDLGSLKTLKPGQVIKIPPVTGVVHKVKSGETIYSIAKKYGVDAQSIVDFPFNTFTNDETFALAIGQELVVPDGTAPEETIAQVSPRTTRTPDAGQVTATGVWVWPTKGVITQPFRPWHKGIDIANHDGGPILAADSGTVIVAGWPDNSGYGNRVVINHNNGYLTLYGHMLRIDVQVGQTVKRGDQLGLMGSTGRSTGTHLHFEIRTGHGNIDPLSALK